MEKMKIDSGNFKKAILAIGYFDSTKGIFR